MIKVGLVGPCAAGKTTLVAGLKEHNYQAKHIAQEHSYVADMWQRLAKPDVLIYLDVSYAQSQKRRRMNWTPDEYHRQIGRLRHARQHADFYLDTDPLTPEEVKYQVLEFLKTCD